MVGDAGTGRMNPLVVVVVVGTITTLRMCADGGRISSSVPPGASSEESGWGAVGASAFSVDDGVYGGADGANRGLC